MSSAAVVVVVAAATIAVNIYASAIFVVVAAAVVVVAAVAANAGAATVTVAATTVATTVVTVDAAFDVVVAAIFAVTMPLKLLAQQDSHSPSMKGEHRKMRLLIAAVIARAQERGEWDVGNSAWDVGCAVRLYNSVKDLFEYPSLTSTHQNIRSAGEQFTIYSLRV